ncbi:MAG: radical SAM family heme chaperone HemW [Gammaproteobacteria bacterium]|nr:radical SAM family heme chaperone HemW [Gammaproteobacteria bacterium]
MLELPPLSLYIHIPWCIKKCPYCDFNSHEAVGSLPQENYLAALLEDFREDVRYFQERKIHSVFIGGGTPSLFPAEFFEKLLCGLRNMASFETDFECTLEANPSTVESGRFSEYRNVGINRLSIGIQSFNDPSLSSLGRVHDSNQARFAIETCLCAGFDNFNLDLMYGLPGQEIDSAILDLETALNYRPAHISWYQLTVEPNTAFYNAPPSLPDEDTIMTMQLEAMDLFESGGLKRYEISAYALPDMPSKHNLNYWTFGDYIGIGAGAHGKITFPDQNSIVRTRKVKQPSHYLNQDKPYLAEQTAIESNDLIIEFMMNALRLTQGFDAGLFERRTGRSFADIEKRLKHLQSQGLLQQDNGRIRPSPKGQLFVNSLLEEFL